MLATRPDERGAELEGLRGADRLHDDVRAARWTIRWKPVLNAFAITFGDRWPAAELY